jgi:hypothetical protein
LAKPAPLFQPPKTIIFDPVQTAVCTWRGPGAPVVVVAVHEFAAGS